MSEIVDLGKHRVQHGDLMEDGVERLMGSDHATIFYSDPPWGRGALNLFQTMNKEMTGAEKKGTDHEAFLHKLFDTAIKYSVGPIAIEYGQRWRDEIAQLGRSKGLQHVGVAVSKYSGGPFDIHVFHKTQRRPPYTDYLDDISQTKGGMGTARAVVEPWVVEDGILLDPCCGLGNQAQAAVEFNMRFRGNELNRARLEKTMARIEKFEAKKVPASA